MTAKHTPGPWTTEGSIIRGTPVEWPRTGTSIKRIPQTIVAVIHSGDAGSYAHYSAPMADANARLIAAAPGLLIQLKAALSDLEYLAPEKFDDEAHEAAWRNTISRHRAAIAEAEGRAP